MAYSDQDLQELKTRTISSMGSGANLARANEHILALIQEIEDYRKGPKVKITGEAAVANTLPAPKPAPVVEVASELEDESEDETSDEDVKAEDTKPSKKKKK